MEAQFVHTHYALVLCLSNITARQVFTFLQTIIVY